MKIFIPLFGIVILLTTNILTQPTPTVSSNNEDQSILTMKPCHVPCWYGIVPGKTTLEEVHKILSNLDFFTLAKGSEEDDYAPYQGNKRRTVIRWWDAFPLYVSSISFNDEIVDYISISPHIDFTLGDVLELYGKPQGIKLNYDMALEQQFVDVTLDAYYPDAGLMVTFLLYSKQGDYYVDSVEIQPTAKGQRFSLFAPQSDLQTFIASILPNYTIDEANDYYRNHIYPSWPGLGALLISEKDYYPIATPVILTAVPTVTASVPSS